MKIYRETRGAYWRKRERRGKRKLVSRTEIAAENPVESSWQKKIEFPTVYAALHHHPRRAICNVYNRPPEDKTNLCVTETRRNFFAGPTADYNPGYQTTLCCCFPKEREAEGFFRSSFFESDSRWDSWKIDFKGIRMINFSSSWKEKFPFEKFDIWNCLWTLRWLLRWSYENWLRYVKQQLMVEKVKKYFHQSSFIISAISFKNKYIYYLVII